MRALISVYDKSGLDAFAKGLVELGWELVASGGTAAYIERLGLAVTTVESLTGFPELLGGRVKTLHPNIHAGILARRELEEDLAALAEHWIEPIDLVCVNLYPFEQAAAIPGVSEDDTIEMIDVGGPSLLRGAAKNHESVTPVCRPEDYERVLDELRGEGEVSPETRRRLATVAFSLTAAYDAAIASWLGEDDELPEVLVAALRQAARPSLRREPAPAGGLLRRARHAHAAPLARRRSCTAASSRSTT